MVRVKVTVSVGTRVVPLEHVSNARVTTAFLAAARDVASKLERITCPTHGSGATNVRLHFEKNGAADLKYDSCCEALGGLIGKALG